MVVTPSRTPVRLRLGTRQSPLAMAQAEEARARLCAAHGWPSESVELVPVRASGDKIQDRPLADIGGKALWTRELDLWLAQGRIDAAVHSMKDVETVRPDSLSIAAILPREDVRDVLIGASSILTIPQGARIGTSAPRRAAQMLHHRPDCRIVSFRGNVATRLAKLHAGEAEVTLLAAAGLNRVGRSGTGTVLEPNEFLPAPAQGAIGLECNRADGPTRELLAAIDDRTSRDTVLAERALLSGLGGTCHSPIAVLSAWQDANIAMRAAIFSADGAVRIDDAITAPPGDTGQFRDLGRNLLRQAPDHVARLFTGAA
ncbi:MAG: hydroxymethylbilane synthase [Pontixanthobacter sp.]